MERTLTEADLEAGGAAGVWGVCRKCQAVGPWRESGTWTMRVRLVLMLAWLAIGILTPLIWIWMLVTILFDVQRAVSIAVAYDRLGNAAMGQGDRETISSWSGRKNGWQEKFINWIFWNLMGEENHCDRYREA